MCRMVIEACKAGNEQVIADVKRIAKYSEGKIPDTAEELCNQIFHTVYMVGVFRWVMEFANFSRDPCD